MELPTQLLLNKKVREETIQDEKIFFPSTLTKANRGEKLEALIPAL